MRVIVRAKPSIIEAVFVVAAVRKESKLKWTEEADVGAVILKR